MDSLRRERLSAGARIQFGFVGAARERPVFALAETHEGLETDRNLSGDREKESGSFLMGKDPLLLRVLMARWLQG